MQRTAARSVVAAPIPALPRLAPLIVTLTCLAYMAWGHPAMAAEHVKPNIIFVMADDLGYGDLGCYGQKVIQTPNLDAMAKQGTRFTDCYAGSPVCAPSRSVLMTGLHTGHTTVRGNFGKGGVKGLGGGNGRVPLFAEDVTVAEVLKQAGYVTAITGKWGLGEPGTTGTPNKQGFDEWFGYLNQRRAHTYYPDFIWRNDKKHPLPGNTGGKKTQYTHDLFTDFALGFIDGHQLKYRDKPFFLYLPYTVPHSRYEIPSVEPYADKPWKKDEMVHAAMVTRLDRDMGRLFARLKKHGIDDKTIVFFCSDNGAAQRWEKRFDSSGALRGRKRDMYEGGIRTPMIVRWPLAKGQARGGVPAGRVDATPWYFADVLPTLAAIAGAKPPAKTDGQSVLPTLLGKKQPELAERPLYWEFFERGFQQAARIGKWKAIRPKKDGPLELYDLSQDLSEKQNIAKQHPDVVKRMADYMASARTESKHWPVKR